MAIICQLLDKVLVSGKSLGWRKSRRMTMICVDLIGYDVVRYWSDFRKLMQWTFTNSSIFIQFLRQFLKTSEIFNHFRKFCHVPLSCLNTESNLLKLSYGVNQTWDFFRKFLISGNLCNELSQILQFSCSFETISENFRNF